MSFLPKPNRNGKRQYDPDTHERFVDSMIADRENSGVEATPYEAPGKERKMQAAYAIPKLGLKQNEAIILASLIWHANTSNGRCDPSVQRLCFENGKDRRTVQRALLELEARGLLTRVQRDGRSNAFKLNWDAIIAPQIGFEARVQQYEKPADGFEGGAVIVPFGVR